MALKFLTSVLTQPKVKFLLSAEHFSFESKNFRVKDGSGPPPDIGGNGLVVGGIATRASGHAERLARCT